jgi:hypothetical protein
MRIFQNYPRKPQTSKQSIGKIPGYEIISSHPLKYSTSKQGLIGDLVFSYYSLLLSL